MALIQRDINEQIRTGLSWEVMWRSADNGLIVSWETGRIKAKENSDLVEKCLKGELPVLAWKGGVDKSIKTKKYGSLYYLAMWQGLRGENLYIESDKDVTLICSKTNVQVIFTPNILSVETSLELENN